MTSKNGAQDGQAANASNQNTSSNTDSENKGGGAQKIPWHVVVPSVVVGAVLLLVGLPIGAVWIVNNTGCCHAGGPDGMITFWAAMIAGFLTLFGMVVTGVFVLTAFKTEANARAEAKDEAEKLVQTVADKAADTVKQAVTKAESVAQVQAQAAAETAARDAAKSVAHEATQAFIMRHKEEQLQKMEQAVDDVAQHAAKVTLEIDQVGMEVKGEMTMAQSEAMGAIAAARDATTAAAGEAQRQIGSLRQDVERQRDETKQAITNAQDEVNAAARTARERIDRAAGSPPQGEGEPE